ncbi:MAG TPA: hypothetical protein VF585_11270 [Chthoniobacterales bacterium]|jgi:hypothetical protein
MLPRRLFPFCLLLAICLFAGNVSAQMRITLEMTRSLYMVNEAVLAKVSITNLSGRDQNLSDAPGKPWLGFEIFAGKNNLIPPVNPNYRLGDLYIPMGQTVTRNINLTPLYGLQAFGPHSVKAVLYDKATEQYYTSGRRAIEMTDGVLIWKQKVGVPQTNSTHVYSLLTHRLPAENRLYLRIVDETGGRIVSCFSVGRVLSFSPPERELDLQNNLHILQMVGPKAYLYTVVSPNGEIVARDPYIDGSRSNPHLFKEESGSVRVRGGKMEQPDAPAKKRNIPRLSDRPVGV